MVAFDAKCVSSPVINFIMKRSTRKNEELKFEYRDYRNKSKGTSVMGATTYMTEVCNRITASVGDLPCFTTPYLYDP